MAEENIRYLAELARAILIILLGTVLFLSWPTEGLANIKVYDHIIEPLSKRYGIDPALVKAIIHVESRFNARAVSRKGASGLMQLLPSTAKRFGVSNIFDPYQNIHGGLRYLAFLSRKFNNDYSLMLAAYNAGENAVIRSGYSIPPFRETQSYVPTVLAYYRYFKGAWAQRASPYGHTRPRPSPSLKIRNVHASRLPGQEDRILVTVHAVNEGGYADAGLIVVVLRVNDALTQSLHVLESSKLFHGGLTMYTGSYKALLRTREPTVFLLQENWRKGQIHTLQFSFIPREEREMKFSVKIATIRGTKLYVSKDFPSGRVYKLTKRPS